MNDERWHRVGELYRSAILLPDLERTALLNKVGDSDSALSREVELLLEADKESGDFLHSSPFELGLRILVSQEDSGSRKNRTADDFIGTVLNGRYLVEKELGRGGVGAVYLARDQKLLNKAVVIKVLLDKSLLDEWVVQKFHQEKEALVRLDHPGVVAILDSGDLVDGKQYLVMQYIEGVTLRQALREHPEGLDFARASSIVRQIGSALGAVHGKRIYHRDLKPENIMLQPLAHGVEQVKIVDFGIAKIKESLIAPSTITGPVTVGTIVYMSPEQLHGDTITPGSDIYSFGVIAYELVTGRRPFSPDTVTQLADMQRVGVRVRPSDLRPRLTEEAEKVILAALEFDLNKRTQSADEFGELLATALLKEADTLKSGKRSEPASVIPVATAPEKTIVDLLESQSPRSLRSTPNQLSKRSSFPAWALVSTVVLLVLLSVAGIFLISRRNILFGSTTSNPTTPSSLEQRSFVYSLNVQKMRDGRPYQEPFQSSGQEIFETGYKFRLNISSPQSGYLYVFNDGTDDRGGSKLTIIYPTPATNSGSAKLELNQPMQTNWNTFAGKPGTEQFWIVWAAAPINELETARDSAFKNAEGAVSDAEQIRLVRKFFTNNADQKLETTKDRTRQQTEVRGNGELIVKLVELEHR